MNTYPITSRSKIILFAATIFILLFWALLSSGCTKSENLAPAHYEKGLSLMQAQDYNMVKWAVGQRIIGSTDELIETALSKGEIIRTHLMRPTWHLVAAEDVHWLLGLTAPRIISSLKERKR